MRVLVTGGAGYIGSVVTEQLLRSRHEVVVLDNFCQGHRDAVPDNIEIIEADIRDSASMQRVFLENPVDAVIHMAAEAIVEHSMTDPRRFFQTNVQGGLNVLGAMLEHNVSRIVFSSTAAVYGEPVETPIREDHPKKPVNAYGESKLMFEKILEWYGRVYGLKYVTMRYFNAAGASERLGEDHEPETHLVPNLLRAALNEGASAHVFGTDYPTRDGSCLRDYVHVIDLANAHILALERLDELNGRAYNLGSEDGHTVFEVVDAISRVTGRDIRVQESPRRQGDPASLVASSNLARRDLGWAPAFDDIDSIIGSAWRWLQLHPSGYSHTGGGRLLEPAPSAITGGK